MLNKIMLGVCIVLAICVFLACYSIRSEAATRRRGEDEAEQFADFHPSKCDMASPRSFQKKGVGQCTGYTTKGTVPVRFKQGVWLTDDVDVNVCKNDACTSTTDTLDNWQKNIQIPITDLKHKLQVSQQDITNQDQEQARHETVYANTTNRKLELQESYQDNLAAVIDAMEELNNSVPKTASSSIENCKAISNAKYHDNDSVVKSVNSDNIPHGCV
jgi:hypothetical protein